MNPGVAAQREAPPKKRIKEIAETRVRDELTLSRIYGLMRHPQLHVLPVVPTSQHESPELQFQLVLINKGGDVPEAYFHSGERRLGGAHSGTAVGVSFGVRAD